MKNRQNRSKKHAKNTAKAHHPQHKTHHPNTSTSTPHKKSISISSKLKAYLELARMGNCIIAGVAILIGFFIIGGFSYLNAALAIISGILVCAGGQAINDYADSKIDLTHSPNRPIPSGRVGRKEALVFSMAMFIIGVIVSYGINNLAFMIACIFAILLTAYPLFMNKVKHIGNVVVAIGTAVTFIYGAAAGGEVTPLIIVLACSAFMANLAREVTKDIEDMKKDKGVKVTRPMMIGVDKAKRSIALYYALAILIGIWAFVQFDLGLLYLAFTIIGGLVFIYAVRELYIRTPRKSQTFSKYGMVVSLIAFIMAGFR